MSGKLVVEVAGNLKTHNNYIYICKSTISRLAQIDVQRIILYILTVVVNQLLLGKVGNNINECVQIEKKQEEARI